MQYLKNIYILKDDYQKALKKLTLCFLLNTVPFTGQEYEKQKRPESSDQCSLGCIISPEKLFH